MAFVSSVTFLDHGTIHPPLYQSLTTSFNCGSRPRRFSIHSTQPYTISAVAKPFHSKNSNDIASASTLHPDHVIYKDDESEPTPRNVHDSADPRALFVNYPEILKPLVVNFNGQVPDFLNGIKLYRPASGRMTETHSDGRIWKAPHLFEILSMLTVTRFDSKTNTAFHIQRLNSNHVIDAIRSTPKSEWTTMNLARTNRSFFQMLKGWKPPILDKTAGKLLPYINFNVTVEKIPGYGLVARTDSGHGQCFDKDSLRQGRQFTFDEFSPSEFKGLNQSISHGMVDHSTGEYFNIIWDFLPMPLVINRQSTFKVFSINSSGETNVLAAIKHAPKFMHSFALSSNYVIVVFPPSRILPGKFVVSFSLGDSLQREDKTTFVVVSRKGLGVVGTFTCDELPIMHTVNAFEDSCGNVVIDGFATMNLVDMCNEKFERLFDRSIKESGVLTRITLPLTSACAEARTQVLCEKTFEIPIINPNLKFKSYHYVYGLANIENLYSGGIRKVDIRDKSSVVFKMKDCMLNEPIFIPDPEGTEEDDGVLLNIAFDTRKKTSYILILNAATLEIIASANLNRPVPPSFHGYVE